MCRDSGSLYNGLGHVRKMNLLVRATDMGSPPLWTNVAVLIFVHDVNDFAPVFTSPLYATNVSEDIAPGSSVLQVRAVDHDGSSPNNLIVYRIQSGGLDKFVIDSTSGMISIANGASLDPDRTDPRTTRYQLEILALDGGLGSNQFHTKTIVNIAVNDVNNKAPILSKLETVYVPENLPTGSVLTQISARDVDDRPVLHYSIDYSGTSPILFICSFHRYKDAFSFQFISQWSKKRRWIIDSRLGTPWRFLFWNQCRWQDTFDSSTGPRASWNGSLGYSGWRQGRRVRQPDSLW